MSHNCINHRNMEPISQIFDNRFENDTVQDRKLIILVIPQQTSKYILIGLSNGMLNIDLIPNLICQDTSLCMTSRVMHSEVSWSGESCTINFLA